MKRRTFAAVLLLMALTLWGENFSGQVTDQRENGVGFATVVLVELDHIETSAEDGSFTFRDISPGTYSLLIIAPGFLEWEGSFVFGDDELQIELSPEVVEMDAIVVTADEGLPEDVLDNEVSEEDLARLPARSDPFDAIPQESGILADIGRSFVTSSGTGAGSDGPPEGPVTISIEGGSIGRLSSNLRNGVSVYGGESDWNNYFYDYIRIPTNTHAFGYPEPDAIVPVEAVDEIGVYKGVIPVEHGPAIGGLFALEPDSGTDGFEFTFTPSVMDISLLSRWSIAPDVDLLVSMNQSIVQFTILPIIGALVQAQTEEDVSEDGNPTSFSYGDALLRVLYTPPNHSLSFDVLAYYDRWLFDISFEDFVLNSQYGPYYVAAGSNWTSSPSASVTNSLYAFASYYSDFGNHDFHFPVTFDFDPDAAAPDAFYDLHFEWQSNVSSVQAGDELVWDVSPKTSLLFGVNGRLADLQGKYTEIVVQSDTAGAELSNETLVLPGVDRPFLSTYAYAKVLGQHERLKYNAGGGLLWYPDANVYRPGLTAEVLFFGDPAVLAIGAGWSPGIIDEYTYIDRRLDEQYYELDTVTELYGPPMAISAASQLALPISPLQTISAAPYFAWYYDLSGIAISTSGSGPEGAFISHIPSKGYSTGVDMSWKADFSDKWNLNVSYAFAWTRYLTEDWGWVAPNTAVGHAVKSGLLYQNKGLKIGQNLLAYSGTPFTPEVVETDALGATVIVPGDYNSATDYVPRFDVRTNVSYQWDYDTFDMSLFLNSSNWLGPINAVTLGIDPEKQDVVGTSSAAFGNRDYEYAFDWTNVLVNLLLSNIGMSFSF